MRFLLSVPVGLLLAFVLPGAALVAALFPRRGLSRLERAVLCVALSLAVLVLGGLALHAAGVRLSTVSWLALTGGVTLLAALVAYLRRVDWAPFPRVAVRPLAPLALAAALLGGAAWLSLATAQRQTAATPVTALSIVDVSGADTAGDTRSLTLEVTNQEAVAASYALTVTGTKGYAVTLQLTVSRAAPWRRSLTVPLTDQVTASLYRAGDTSPYRTVHLHDGSVVQQ
jgi:hypothetical protein